MKKKILLFILMMFFSFVSFCEEWKVCLGSFKILDNAKKRVELLNENGIPVAIEEYQKDENTILYRIFYSEILKDKESALLHKKLLSNFPPIKEMQISDVWFLEVTEVLPETELQIEAEPEENSVVLPPINPEKRTILIKDSDTGNPIPEADVNIDDKWDVKSDLEGKAPIPDEVQDGEHKLYVTKGNEYVKTEGSFVLEQGEITSTPQVSLPKAVDFERIKIVLDWGEYPSDLDSHIVSRDYHVYYSRMQQGNLELDRDDTSSYGPETVTIKEPAEDDVYKYYVFNYSDGDSPYSSRLSNSEAQVRVFIDNEFKTSFKITPTQEGITWHVFNIINGNEIVPINTVSSIRPSDY